MIYWKHLGHVERGTYRNLKRAWIGFKIAKQKGNYDKMKYYAKGIQKLQRRLGMAVSSFSDIVKANDLNSTRQKEEGGTATNEP